MSECFAIRVSQSEPPGLASPRRSLEGIFESVRGKDSGQVHGLQWTALASLWRGVGLPPPANGWSASITLRFGGRGGIRTHGDITATLDFESSALDRTQPPFRFTTGCLRPPDCLPGRLCQEAPQFKEGRFRDGHSATLALRMQSVACCLPVASAPECELFAARILIGAGVESS